MLLFLTLLGCEGSVSRSSIPNAGVAISVNVEQFPEFTPLNTCTGFTVTRAGGYQRLNGDIFIPPTVSTICGYSGVLVVNGLDGKLAAYDLSCPKCWAHGKPLTVLSYAKTRCEICGEEYDTTYSFEGGTGFPTKGINREGLRRYKAIYNPYTRTIEVYN